MVYHSDDYLWHLILRGKTKKMEKLKKSIAHPNTKFRPISDGRNDN